MAEKLTASNWTTLVKKLRVELGDEALVKALTKVDKTDTAQTQAYAQALAEVAEQINKLVPALVKKKKDLGDKVFNEVKDKLYGLLETAESARKGALAQASDDEEDSPALLTTSMTPLVKQLLKGDVQMHALVANGSKKAAILIMRKSVAPSRKKLLSEYLGETSGVKYPTAVCSALNGQLVFELDAAPGGLAKRLRQAIFEQTGLRVKLVLKFGDQVESAVDDLDPDELNQPGPNTGKPPSNTSNNLPPSNTTPGTGKIPQAPPSPDAKQLAFVQRLKLARDKVEKAIQGKHPQADKMRAIMELVAKRAGERDFDAAATALDALDTLLGAPTGNATPKPQTPPTANTKQDAAAPNEDLATLFKQRMTKMTPLIKAAVDNGSPAAQQLALKAKEAVALAGRGDHRAALAVLEDMVKLLQGAQKKEAPKENPELQDLAKTANTAFTKVRLAWDQTRKFVQEELKKLQSDIHSQIKREEEAEEIDIQYAARVTQDTPKLFEILETLDLQLIDILDDALNSQPPKRQALHSEALDVIQGYIDFVNTDPLLQAIDDNGFIPLNIKSTLTTRLSEMEKELKAA